MIRLIKIELNKVLFNKAVLIMLGFYFVLFILSAMAVDGIIKNMVINAGDGMQVQEIDTSGFTILTYPGIWGNLSYLAGWFNIILAVILIILVNNEFNYRTLRQNIIDGMSKLEVILAKQIVILLISIVSTVYLAISVFLLGNNEEGVSLFKDAQYLLSYFIAVILYLNFAYFLASLLKKAALAIGLLLVYSVIIEPLAVFNLPENVGRFFPMEVISNLIPSPFGKITGDVVSTDLSFANVSVCVAYIIIFSGINYLLMKRGKVGK